MYKSRIKRKEEAIKRTEAQLAIYEQKLVDDKGNKDLKNSIFQRFLIDGIKPTPFSADYFFQGLDNGDLVLFPSIMNHSVQQNETDQSRISLAFNTFFFGVLGEYENSSELILKQGK